MSAIQRMSVIGRKIGWTVSRRLRTCRASSDLVRTDATFVVLSHADPLAQTQIYPFHLWARQIARRCGARLREIALSDFLASPERSLGQVKWLAFQTGWDLADADMLALLRRIRRAFPEAQLIYLDWFAPLDLRYARVLNPYVARYVKKQLFADSSAYGSATLGDTNLTDYYGSRYRLPLPAVRHPVPAGFQSKLVIGTNFCVSPQLLDAMRGHLPRGERPIDVHARMATRGTDWYRCMREEARAAALAVAGIRTACGGTVPPTRFLQELRTSKICFSPFGYGEVCWRDFEAIMCGAVLVKPRMDHVKLAPQIFTPGQTYVPIAWDYSDYEEAVRSVLANERVREQLAANAFERVRDYLRSDAVPDQLQALFAPVDAAELSPRLHTASAS